MNHDTRGPVWLILELISGSEAGHKHAALVPQDCYIAWADQHWKIVSQGPLSDTTGLAAACAAAGIEVPTM